jgi:chemotaxis protein MotB
MQRMADDNKRPIIIKKKKVIAGGHHGGAWKVAYADFVTAMMAFFLLMWLLNATTEKQRKGLADYFNPQIPISEVSGGGNNVLSGDTVFSKDILAQSAIGGKDSRQGDDGVEKSEAERKAEILEEEKMQEVGTELIEEVMAMDATEFEGDMLSHLKLTLTDEGLLIEVVDIAGQALFESGSKQPSEKFKALMKTITNVINTVDNPIRVNGHTDAKTFSPSSTYTNWELSADRANVARSLIESYGFLPSRIASVSGLADTKPLSEDPFSAENRRITVILLKQPL